MGGWRERGERVRKPAVPGRGELIDESFFCVNLSAFFSGAGDLGSTFLPPFADCRNVEKRVWSVERDQNETRLNSGHGSQVYATDVLHARARSNTTCARNS